MKKIIALVFFTFCAVSAALTQDNNELNLTISGEAKTGFFAWWKELGVWTQDDYYGDMLLKDEGADIANSEFFNWMNIRRIDLQRGFNQGLYRLNFHVEKGNIGAKFRFEMFDFSTGTINWTYAFLYGSFFNDQFKTAVGKLGESPWGTGEPELDKELDNYIGMRFEYLPSFIPGLGIGFVLNNWNSAIPQKTNAALEDLLQETVVGISYTNDYFHARVSYRFDSEVDGVIASAYRDQGTQIAYRIEERAIQKVLPGFQIWNVGYFEELGNKDKNAVIGANYLYTQYDPDNFTARLRLGYNITDVRRLPSGGSAEGNSREWISIVPSFYYKLFNNFLSVGSAFGFELDVGDGLVSPGDYLSWYVEPQIRLNIDSGFYIAFVYRYHDDYYVLDIQNEAAYPELINSKTHWFNLRAVFKF